MDNINNKVFLEQLKNYENQWVALDKHNKEILADGNTLKETKEKADKIGKEYLFLKVLLFNISYVPTHNKVLLKFRHKEKPS